MTIACDFCLKQAERNDALVFIAAPSGLAHICEECVEVAVDVAAGRKQETGCKEPQPVAG